MKKFGTFLLLICLSTLVIASTFYTGDLLSDNTSVDISDSTYLESDYFNATTKNQTWLEFDGDGDYANVSINLSGQNLTIVSFAKPISNASRIRLMNSVGDSIWTTIFGGAGDNHFCNVQNNSGTVFNDNIVFAINKLNTWNQFSCIFDGSSITASLNSINSGSPTSINGAIKNSNVIYLGSSSTPNEFWNGSIGDFRIYNKSISVFTLQRLYNESIYGRNLGDTISILNYHRIRTTGTSASDTNLSDFEIQMEYLNDIGAETINYDNLIDWLNGEFTLPKVPVIIQFDDGYLTTINNAKPVMDLYGFKGVDSIVTGDVGTGEFSSWENLTTLKDAGWQIVSHSQDHVGFTTINKSERSSNFSVSKQDIIDNLGITTRIFIYPFADTNSSIDLECLNYYDYCISNYGTPSSPRTNYKDIINSLNIERISFGNTTTQEQVETIFEVYTPILYLKLNENSGTTVYDSSGNANNGTITGATWQDDGINNTLVLNTDYTITNEGIFTIINQNYYWSGIDYSFYLVTKNLSYFATSVLFILDLLPIAGILLVYIIFSLIYKNKINAKAGIALLIFSVIVMYSFHLILNNVLRIV